MTEIRGSFGFGMKAADFRFARQPSAQNHLQSHHTIQRRIARLVDDTHSASRNFINQDVVAESLSKRRSRVCLRCRAEWEEDPLTPALSPLGEREVAGSFQNRRGQLLHTKAEQTWDALSSELLGDFSFANSAMGH